MYAIMDGEKIEAMREERGLSRQQFAAEARFAPSTVTRVERGERVKAATGWRVAGVFGMHPKDLGTPAPTQPWLREMLGLDA